MISKELLELLVCPENRTPLVEADAALVKRLNEAIGAGTLKNRGGQRVEQPCDAALVRADRTLAYLVLDGIPVMLVDEAVPLAQLDS
jgi:uncharacterized protein YbaR (Trm112 family)